MNVSKLMVENLEFESIRSTMKDHEQPKTDSDISSPCVSPTESIVDLCVRELDANKVDEQMEFDEMIRNISSTVLKFLDIDKTSTYSDVEASVKLNKLDTIMSAVAQAVVADTCLFGRRQNSLMDADEPLTIPDPCNYALGDEPIRPVVEMYKKQEASFWTLEEIDFGYDDLSKLNEDEQFFIKHVLAFFATADGIVSMNIAENLQNAFTPFEICQTFAFQNAMEGIHSETYSALINHYVKNKAERHRLFNAIRTMPCVEKKAAWAIEWTRKHRKLSERLVAFAAIEGILFSASFCAIYYLKMRHPDALKGLYVANEFIARDEGMHCDFGCMLHGMLQNKCDEEVAAQIVRSAVDVELDFALGSLPVRLLGMNSGMMSKYIKFCANRLMVALGYDKIYPPDESKNEFDFMELISLQSKDNFFEKRVTEYQLSGVMSGFANEEGTDKTFDLDADF